MPSGIVRRVAFVRRELDDVAFLMIDKPATFDA